MIEHLRKSLAMTRQAAGKLAGPTQTLPGFDPAAYLAINPDVAAAGVDPHDHFARFGWVEARGCLFPKQGIDDPESRMLDLAQRQDWLPALRKLARETPLRQIIENHPRAGWMRAGFSLAGYMQECPRVAAEIDDPLEAAFHFLEFGLEAGRHGHPETWDAAFVEAQHKMALPEDIAYPKRALAYIVASGVSPLDAVLDESQFWDRSGLNGTLLAARFDHEYYHAQAQAEGRLKPKSSRARQDMIRHFLKHGIDALTPIAPDAVFDAGFYAQQLDAEIRAGNPAGSPVDRHARDADRRLYRHWLGAGSRLKLAPNLASWGKIALKVAMPDEIFRQMPVFARAIGLDPATNPVTLLKRLVNAPKPGAAALDLSDPDSADVLLRIADRLATHRSLRDTAQLSDPGEVGFTPVPLRDTAGAEDRSEAEWLAWVILTAWPDHVPTRHWLATLLQRDGRTEMAQSLRRDLAPDAGEGWNTIRLAELQIRRKQLSAACETLIRFPEAYEGDVALRGRRQALAREIFDTIWTGLGRYVAAHGIDTTQAHLRKALDAYTPAFSSVTRARPIRRVALVGNEDLFQCKLYRVDQKAEQLRGAGLDVTVVSPSRELAGFTARVAEYDAVIFFRVPAFPAVVDAIAAAAQQGVMTFYEIDDLVFDSAHFPPSLESYAGQITAKDYAAMACGVPLFEHAMSLCDYGIASTATIADLMRQRVRRGEVIEHHNALGRLHMAALEATSTPREADTPVTLLYASGTKAHKEDFHNILEPALAKILSRHKGKVRLRLVGHFGGFRHLDPNSPHVDIHQPVWDFEAYCGIVAKADINLSVLSPSLLTDAKSEIKWMEAAMFAIPSVVSDTATHREVIEDGVTGFLAADTKGFVAAIDKLMRDPALRRQVGQTARDKVLRDYGIEAMGTALRDAMTRLRPATSAKNRLMVVNVFYPPQAIGGATRVVHDNVQLLQEQYGDQYEIDVVCTLEHGTTPYSVTPYARDGVRVWAITAPRQRDSEMTATDPKMADVFERLVDRVAPDLIHFHCIQRLTASVVNVARLRKIPYLITLHDGWWISPNQFILDNKDRAAFYDYSDADGAALPKRAQSLLRPLQGAARLLAVSESFARLHHDCGLRRVESNENGVSSLPASTRTVSRSGRVRLAHIGGATRHKGIHIVRNALVANRFRNLDLLVVDHSYRPGQETREHWGTTPVTVCAKVPQSQISGLLGRVDVLLAPSTWPESYGLVTREALAAGLWVIASDRGAIGDDIEDGVNGFRVDVGSYDAMAEVLAQIDREPERFRNPPPTPTTPRGVADQVRELVEIYDAVLSEARSG